MEKPVTFLNKNGKKLFGIIHIPENRDPRHNKIGINLLNPGIKYRVAPNRLNVKLARKLCELGYHVLRFDPEGIGDSEGELPAGILVADIWEKIQTGLFVPDTIAANDFLSNTYGIERLILIGNCGGAITALLASEEDRRVDSLALIDVPVNLRTAQQTFADKVATGGKKVDILFSDYFKKIFDVKAWLRFITLQTEYRALWKIVRLKLQKKLSRLLILKKPPLDFDKVCREKNLNEQFFKAFDAFHKKGKSILFILAGNDPGTEIFQHYFENTYLTNRVNTHLNSSRLEIFLIEQANHIYTLTEWQKTLINKICTWVA